jgi:hypothetical protein
MSGTDRTRPTQQTREEEERDAQVRAGEDRDPTPEEEERARKLSLDAGVAENYEEAIERGAKQKGEGRID